MPEPTKDEVEQMKQQQAEDAKRAGSLEGRVRAAVKGLAFQTNRKIEKAGEPTRYVPAERPMAMADVLASRLDGQVLTLITADGRKHRIGPKAD